MSNDSYRIDTENITLYVEMVINRLEEWKKGLIAVANSFQDISRMTEFTGIAAEKAKETVAANHSLETGIPYMIISLSDDLKNQLLLYEQKYKEYDGDIDGKVIYDAEMISGFSSRLIKVFDDICNIKEDFDKEVTKCNDLIDFSPLDIQGLTDLIEEGKTRFTQIDETVTDIEDETINGENNIPLIEEKSQSIKNLINEYLNFGDNIVDVLEGQSSKQYAKCLEDISDVMKRSLEEEACRVQDIEKAKAGHDYTLECIGANEELTEEKSGWHVCQRGYDFTDTSKVKLSKYNEKITDEGENVIKGIDNPEEIVKAVNRLSEEKKAYENAMEKDPSQMNYYKNKIRMLEAQMEQIEERSLEKSQRSEELTFVYGILKEQKYSSEEIKEIFVHWMGIENEEDILGNEMPEYWMKEHLTLPEDLEVKEENVIELLMDENKETQLINFYLSGYLLVDCISGRTWQEIEENLWEETTSENYDSLTIRSYYKDYLTEKESNTETYIDKQLMLAWYDASYGGMLDYKEGTDSVRAVKYALETYMNFPHMYDEQGVYKYYDNNENGYYKFCVNSYINKYDHAEDYYENIKTSDTNTEKILSYIETDKKGEIKEFEENEWTMLSKSRREYTENGDMLYKNVYDIAKLLERDDTVFSYGGEEYKVTVEGNKIIIKAVIIDDMDYASHRHEDEYIIDLSDSKKEAFNSIYIDQETFSKEMEKFATYRYENNWISKETIEEWGNKIDACASELAKEIGFDYEGLNEEDKEEIIKKSIIYADCGDKMLEVYKKDRETASEEFNEFWDEMMFGMGICCAFLFMVTPAGFAEGATFLIGAVDGTKKIIQGDTLEGGAEILMSAVGTGAYIYKEVREAQNVARMMEGAGEIIDDLDYAVDGSKFGDLKYINANPLDSEFYHSYDTIFEETTTSNAAETFAKNVGEQAYQGGNSSTVISQEMQNKILEGQRVSSTKNDIIGGHSSTINNDNPLFAVEVLSENADGTKTIKYVKDFQDGNISKIKKSTIFPETWSESDIIEAIKITGDSPVLATRARDGATFHRQIINGVEIDVIKIGNNVTSGYPTGKVGALYPSGF